MGEEQISNEALAGQLKDWMSSNGYGKDFGEGLTKLVDEIVLLTKTGIGVARKVDQDHISRLMDENRKVDRERCDYKMAFERLKEVVKNFVEGLHWVLRLSVLGGSFWFLGWRFSAGVLAFILADELIREGKRKADEIKP